MASLDRLRSVRRAAALRTHAKEAPLAAEICIIESDASVRSSLVWLLESFAVGVLAFAPTEEFMREASPSLACVLLDVELRGLDKVSAFIGELRHRGLVVPIVAMSADPFLCPDDVHRAGAIAFLAKPFASDALLDCLREARARSAALVS